MTSPAAAGYPGFDLRFEYDVAIAMHRADPSFYGLVMAAMLGADEENQRRLRLGFEDVWQDLQARHAAPFGALAGERP